jgi:hypothetical protein
MIKVTIVIPVFNGLEYTKNCLDSIHRQLNKISEEKARYSIVVCDDGSTDGTSSWIENHFPNVHLIHGNGDLWWSGGINKGVEHALIHLEPDYILWWNNDIIAADDYFEKAIDVLNENGNTTIIGSKVYLAQYDKRIWSMGGTFNPYSGLKDLIGRGLPDEGNFSEPIECDWLPGMGTIIHCSVFEKIGYVDAENFPQYHGDSDFTYRAKLNGYKILVDPRLKIFNDTRNSGLIHKQTFSSLWKSLFSIRSNYNLPKNIVFYRKYARSPLAYKALLIHYFRYIGGFIKWKILGASGLRRKNSLT